MQPAPHTVAAAFAQERDVHYAVRLLSVAVASFAEPAVASRIETAMEGAHGMVVPIETLDAAKTA